MKNNQTKMLTEAAISVALAQILSYIKLFRYPLGGSITLVSMLPLIIYSIRWGRQAGTLVSMVYGLVHMLLGGYVISPIQGILDYVLCHGAMGISGIPMGDRKKKSSYVLPIILAYVVSALFNVISGQVFFYDMGVAEGAGFHNFLAYNFALNFGIKASDCAILLVVFLLTFDRMKTLYQRQN